MAEFTTSGARVLKAMIGLGLIFPGLLFMGVLYYSYERAKVTLSWPEVPATILISQVNTERVNSHAMPEHRADVRYHYHYDGVDYTGSKIKRVEKRSGDKVRIQKILEDYPVRAVVPCYVNPADPNMAILQHDTRAGIYTLWFPFLFVAAGMGILITAFKGDKSKLISSKIEKM